MGEMQQVQNGEMKYCLHKDNSIHNCAKHVWEFLMQEMVKSNYKKFITWAFLQKDSPP